MTSAQPSTYGIPEVELSHIFKWLSYQAKIGSRTPVSDNSLFNYFGPFHGIVQSVNRIDNPVFEKIITDFISTAIGDDQTKVWSEMKIVVDYYHYLTVMPTPEVAPAGSVEIPYESYRFPWNCFFYTFLGGYGYKTSTNTFYRLDNGYNKDYNGNEPFKVGQLQTPGSKSISDHWGQTYIMAAIDFMNRCPVTHIAKGEDITKKAETTTAQKALLTTLNTTSQFPVNYVKRMEATQLVKVNDLLKLANVTAEGYFVLFLLIMGLNSSGAADQALAKKIVKAPSGSDGYPNDTFINQLIYLSLLHMVDPAGPYKWNNAQLIKIMTVIKDLNTRDWTGDDTSAAIKSGVEKHLAILRNNTNYPLNDPNYIATFEVRKADTLAALEETRATLKPTT